jgi:tryptophanyl-tRNA synthetase
MKKRVVSAIAASGSLHIGNYLGAVKQFVDLQNEYETFVFVADLHAITVPQDPKKLRQKTIEIARIYLAAGLDPQKCVLFVQSQVPAHAELAWILNTVARMGDMEKMTQFKDKSQKEGVERASVGLFSYPILMAADILLYDAQVVPVGDDQTQHIELTRTLARRFNELFGETFVIPEVKIMKEGARIMALDNPEKKMSKSAASEYNFIALRDTAETIAKKIKKAVTDSGSEVVYSDDKPALKNLINIYALFDNKTPDEVVAQHADQGYGNFKNNLTEVLVRELGLFQEKMNMWTDEKVLTVLATGRQKAEEEAIKKLQETYETVGFLSK